MAGNVSWKKFSTDSNVSAEIKSHSSVLFNERLNATWMMYDLEVTDLEIKPELRKIIKTKALLSTVWRNIRPILSNNESARKILRLDTIKPGIYTVDSGFAHVQECILWLMRNNENNTYENLLYVIHQIQAIELIIRECLQYFSYFVRTDKRQKPDINIASKKYEEMADERTMEEFKSLLGDRNNILKNSLEVPVSDEFFDNEVDELEAEEYD